MPAGRYPPRAAYRGGPSPEKGSERLVIGVVAVLAGGSLVCWLAGGLSMLASGHGWHETDLAHSPWLLVAVASNPRSIVMAWPKNLRAMLGPPLLLYGCLSLVAVVTGALAWAAMRAVTKANPAANYGRGGKGIRRNPGHLGSKAFIARGSQEAAWATAREIAPLVVRQGGGGRLVLGRCGRLIVAAQANQSVLVVGPTQSGKTSGLAVPAILEWEGPVVATSVKTDLLRDTLERRRAIGDVKVYDPTGITNMPSASWSPLTASMTWQGALSVAAGMCSVARSGQGGLEDGSFWYATAEKLIAPLLFAAQSCGATISDVVGWIDTGEEDEVISALTKAGDPAALRAAMASFGREDRTRSSVYATAETILGVYADPSVAKTAAFSDIDPEKIVAGGLGTLYLVAPAHDQQRLAPVFVAILKAVQEAAFGAALRNGRPLSPAVLIVLDEAANIAPVENLDSLAATAAGHGVQLLTVFQDLAQVQARYGPRWATVVNNHRAKIVCSGIADPTTLDHFSALVGECDVQVGTSSVDRSGNWTFSNSVTTKKLAPADKLRRLQPGQAVLIYGHLPPVKIALRMLHLDRTLIALAKSDTFSSRPTSPWQTLGRSLSRHLQSWLVSLLRKGAGSPF